MAGTVGFVVLSEPAQRAALSYLAGLALVVAALEFGAFTIRYTSRKVPHLTMVAALVSYGATAVALGVLAAASSPRVVYGPAIATGLCVGLAVWVGTEIRSAGARSAPH